MPHSAKKVLYLVDQFPARSETFIVDNIRELLRLGFEVVVVSTKINSEMLDSLSLPRDRLRVIEVVSPIFGIAGLFRRGWRLVRAILAPVGGVREAVLICSIAEALRHHRLFNFEWAVAQYGWNGVRLVALQDAGVTKKSIVYMHAVDIVVPPVRFRGAPYKRMFNRIDQVVVVSEYMRTRVSQLGCKQNKILVQYLGLPSEKIERLLVTKRNAIKQDCCLAASIGRLVDKKGFDDALKAVRLLLDAGVKVKYDIVGDGPLRSELAHLVESLGLEGVVRMHGALDNADALSVMSQADFFLMPSRMASDGDMEGLPIAVMEAMAAGRIVVTTTHSGIAEVINNEANGIAVDERAPTQIKYAILKVLGDPDLQESIRQGAVNTVLSHFRSDVTIRPLAEIIGSS